MALFDLYTVAVLGLWAWKKWVAPDSYLTGVVEANVRLNERPARCQSHLDEPSWPARPGDFYFLRFEGPGTGREWHPYSATDASREVLAPSARHATSPAGPLPRPPAPRPQAHPPALVSPPPRRRPAPHRRR